jgi:hypothetical protein
MIAHYDLQYTAACADSVQRCTRIFDSIREVINAILQAFTMIFGPRRGLFRVAAGCDCFPQAFLKESL